MSRERTAEEDALLDVLADLIEKFESRTYPGLGSRSIADKNHPLSDEAQ
jgi:hypothetical protein